MRLIFLPFLSLIFFYEGDHDHHASAECRVEFKIQNAGIEVTGTLGNATAEIHFDEKRFEKSTITASASPREIRTGIPIRDKHLQRSDYFNSELFPEIKLTSTSFTKVGRNQFLAIFKLTIKETTKQVEIPFSIVREGSVTLYTGSFEINRLDFGLGEESLILDKKVEVLVTARLVNK